MFWKEHIQHRAFAELEVQAVAAVEHVLPKTAPSFTPAAGLSEAEAKPTFDCGPLPPQMPAPHRCAAATRNPKPARRPPPAAAAGPSELPRVGAS